MLQLLRANALQRARRQLLAQPVLGPADQQAVQAVYKQVELGKIASINSFATLSRPQSRAAIKFINALGQLTDAATIDKGMKTTGNTRVYRRNSAIKGTMHAFGYSYIEDHLPADQYAALALTGARAYEALNLVDGRRTVSDIRNWLCAEFGAAELTDVAAYLDALQQIGVLKR